MTERFRRQGIDVTIWPQAKVAQRENIELGSHVIIDDFAFVVGGRSTRIGDHVHIASHCSLTGGGELVLEEFSGLSSGVRIYTGNEDYKGGCLTNPTVPAPFRQAVRSFVRIGRHAIIGANAVILPGVTIGEGAAIGACSLVRRDCEPWTIYAGVPARPIGRRPGAEILAREEALRARYGEVAVSVCCLTYNHEAFLRQALDSFLMQKTCFPFEVLVHDDASTDKTPEILREYAERFPGIVRPFFEEENQLRKTGVYPILPLYAAARGRYVAECDGDDFWTDPQKLQKQVDFLEARPDCVMCHHGYEILEAGKRRRPHGDEDPRDYEALELVGLPVGGHGIGYATRMWRNLYGPETAADFETFLGDYPLLVMMGMHGKCGAVREIGPSVYRRKHGGNSWCGLPPDEMARRTQAMHRRIYQAMAKKGNPRWIAVRRGFLEGGA